MRSWLGISVVYATEARPWGVILG